MANAAKYDIVRSKISGAEFVVEKLSKHVSGVVYCCICLADLRGAALFDRDIEIVTRHQNNIHLDLGKSELAQSRTHAVAMVNAERKQS